MLNFFLKDYLTQKQRVNVIIILQYSFVIHTFSDVYSYFYHLHIFFLLFFCHFAKGNNFRDFLFAFLDNAALPKWGKLLKERICSYGSKFFTFRVDP